MNVSLGWILILIGVICFVLASVGFPISVNLFYLGWAFVVAGALLAERHAP